jgi:hypothetical protein
MKHQLSSLRVLRPKIAVPKRPIDPAAAAKLAVQQAITAAGEAAMDTEVSEPTADSTVEA